MNPATLKLIAALAQAGGLAYAGYAETGATEEGNRMAQETATLNRGEDRRQFDEEMRFKRRQQRMTDRTSSLAMLGSLDSLRQKKRSTADYLTALSS